MSAMPAPPPARVVQRVPRIDCPSCVAEARNGILYERVVTNARGMERLFWCNVCSYGYAIPLPARAEPKRRSSAMRALLRDPIIRVLLFFAVLGAAAYALAAH